MDIDVAYWARIFALVLLVPGLLMLFIAVFYIAFVGRDTPRGATANNICMKCGQTLLPGQTTCPNCEAEGAPRTTTFDPTAAKDGNGQVEAIEIPSTLDDA